MDNKGRLGMRNWEFSDHMGRANSSVKPLSSLPPAETNPSAHRSAYLKMSPYTNQNDVIGESNSDATPVGFSWFPQRNFITKNLAHLQPAQSSAEMIETPNIPEDLDNNTLHTDEHEVKPVKGRKQQPSGKRTNQITTKALRPKEPKKQPSTPTKKKASSGSSVKREKKNQEIILEEETLDFSGVPSPVCSCTGMPRQCYRWGAGGWQSSCCTTSISEYPLPMSPSRPGARLAGRKMSISAYGKLLHRLASEGLDLSYAVDLKDHWARHGTNKFVTIK